ncbi:pyridine nucleotide-disulfide oxidoreductase (plasmid) [Deinococcus aetherius]|uniref:Pyridine nucleotide-disulfide oxidoreductase n=1 Tax=Deinococcus aetherius TaxID=200252 RepID=A0ABM8AJ62_9DEIO|nr:NAD(P)/FAD-dependent oxidoreductase [Deinococcus aetherius]BDP43839.1 pyridine nucleotide-disulfide oxidoreductase [Deinococcus aetherius]
MTEAPLHDTLIIGGGPAGLSAATHLAFHRRDVVVIDRASGPLRYTTTPLHNVPGFVGERGVDILKRLRGDAEGAGARLVRSNVTRVSGQEGDFTVETDVGTFRARTLLLATGVARHHPRVSGRFEPWLPYAAKGNTYYCPDCESPEVLGQDVLVIGVNSPVGAASVALTLSEFAREVRVLLTDSEELDEPWAGRLARRGITWQVGEIAAVEGKRGHLDALTLADGTRLTPEGVFVVGPKTPRNDLAVQLGLELSEKGHVKTGWRGQTNVPDVWAAGDVQPQTQQVSVALGSGNIAAVMIDQTLTRLGLRDLGREVTEALAAD